MMKIITLSVGVVSAIQTDAATKKDQKVSLKSLAKGAAVGFAALASENGVNAHGHMFNPAPRNVRTDTVGGCVGQTCPSACRDNLATYYNSNVHNQAGDTSCPQYEGGNPWAGQGNLPAGCSPNSGVFCCSPGNPVELDCAASQSGASCCPARHFENIREAGPEQGPRRYRPDLWEFRGTHPSGQPYTGRTLCLGEENKGSGKLNEGAKVRLLNPALYQPTTNYTAGDVVTFEWAPTASHAGIFGYAIRCSGEDVLPANWEEIDFEPMPFTDENGDELVGGTESHGYMLSNDKNWQAFELGINCANAGLEENNCQGTAITMGCTCKESAAGARDPAICQDLSNTDRSYCGSGEGFADIAMPPVFLPDFTLAPGCRPHFKSYHRIPETCSGHAVVVQRYIGHNQNAIWENCADVRVGSGNGQPFPQ